MHILRQASAIIILLSVSIPSLAHTQISNIPEGKAPNLIVYVHGCCTDEENDQDVTNLRNRLWEAYQGQAFVQSGEWEIVVWDWSRDTPKHNYFIVEIEGIPVAIRDIVEAIALFLDDANAAYDNAASQSFLLASAIAIQPQPYKHVHLIGHSAGAKLINEAAKLLAAYFNQLENVERPFIHLTFLDAYTRTAEDSGEARDEDSGEIEGYGYLNNYPEHYAEHYVARDPLNLTSLPGTDAILRNAFNFDISRWDHDPSEGGFLGHSWPVNWYIKSITAPEPEFTYLRYGYPLSREGGNQQFINVMGQLYPPPSSDPSDPTKGLITLTIYPDVAGVPVITEVVFPPSIIGDGQDVTGVVKFADVDAFRNAGINWAQFDELGDTCAGCTTSWGYDPEVSDLTEGQFEFSLWCRTNNGFFVSKKLTLRDRSNNESNPYVFLYECQPSPIARSFVEAEAEDQDEQGGGF